MLKAFGEMAFEDRKHFGDINLPTQNASRVRWRPLPQSPRSWRGSASRAGLATRRCSWCCCRRSTRCSYPHSVPYRPSWQSSPGYLARGSRDINGIWIVCKTRAWCETTVHISTCRFLVQFMLVCLIFLIIILYNVEWCEHFFFHWK